MKSLSVGQKLGQETPARRFVGGEVTLVSFQSHTGQFAGYRTSKDQSAGMRAIYKRSKRLRLRIGSDRGAVRDPTQLTIIKVAVRRVQRQSNKRLERALSRDQGDQGRACLGSALDLRSHERSGPSAIRVVAQAEHVGAIDRPHASTPTGREDVPDVAGAPCDQHVLHWRYAPLLVAGRLRPLMELL
jgi:hypothetical protein